MKKIRITAGMLIIMLVFNMIFTSAALADDWRYSPIKASISIENNGVYSAEELDEIIFEVFNSSSLTRTFTEKISLKDAYNYVLWNSDISRKLAPKTTEKKSLNMIKFSVGDYVLSYSINVGGIDYSEEINFYCSGDTLILNNQGVNEHFLGSAFHTDRDISNMKHGGYSIFRASLGWSNVEKEKGVYALPDNVTEPIDKIKESGIEALVCLSGNNALYGENDFPKTDAEVNGFANFCAYVVGQLKGKVKYYEMFNEPNSLHQIWGSDYVKLIKAAYPAIKAADPDAVVLGVSQAGIWWPNNVEADFMKQVFQAGGAPYMDAVSAHAYPDLSKVAVDEHPYSYKQVMDCIVDAMCGANLPIWITETGYGSMPNEYGSVDEYQQAAYEARLMVMFDEDGRADKMMKYQLKDLVPDPDMVFDQAHFGLTYNDGTIKPNYRTTTAKNKLTAGMTFAGKDVHMDSSKKGYSVYSYAKDSKKVYILWANGGNEYSLNITAGAAQYSSAAVGNTLNISVPKSSEGETVTVRDAYGNIIKDTSSLTLDFMPKYIICGDKQENIGSADININGNTVTVSGKSAEPNQSVTIRIAAQDEIDLPKGYANQCKSDSQRNFSFTAELESGAYCVLLNSGNVIERYITIEGEAPAESDEMNVSVDGNTAVISGTSIEPNQNVSVRIFRKGNDTLPFAYANQCVSDDERRFSFTAELEKGKYTAVVNNGNSKQADFEIKPGISLSKDGVSLDNLNGVKDTDTLEADFYLEGISKPLYAIAAFYKGGRLAGIKREEVTPGANGIAEKKLTISADERKGTDEIACFVWNSSLKPYWGAVRFK